MNLGDFLAKIVFFWICFEQKYVFFAILGKSANYQESLNRIFNAINNFFAIPPRTKILVARKLFSSMRNRMKTFSPTINYPLISVISLIGGN